MQLKVQRNPSKDDATIGSFFIDGVFHYFSLEDVVREVAGQPVAQWKVQNRTAIPRGVYDVIIDYSTRFKRDMPHVLNVPGFTGIRIHSGNTDADTDGCILLGMKRTENEVLESRIAFDEFFPRLKTTLDNKEKVTIEII